jgi:hypothetical protein
LRLPHFVVKNVGAIRGDKATIRRKAEQVLLSGVNTLTGRSGYRPRASRVGQRHHGHHAIQAAGCRVSEDDSRLCFDGGSGGLGNARGVLRDRLLVIA